MRQARKENGADNRPYASKLQSNQDRLQAVMDKTAKGVLTQGQELCPQPTVVQTTLTQITSSRAKIRPIKTEGKWFNRITKTGFPKTTKGKAHRCPSRSPSKVARYLKDEDSILSDHSDDFEFENKETPKKSKRKTEDSQSKIVSPTLQEMCKHCKKPRSKCHEVLFGSSCFDEVRYFMYENDPNCVSLDELAQKYTEKYHSNFVFHFHSIHNRRPNNNEVPVVIPPCMSDNSYKDTLHFWLTTMGVKVVESIENNIIAYTQFALQKKEEHPNKKPKGASKNSMKEEIEEEEV